MNKHLARKIMAALTLSVLVLGLLPLPALADGIGVGPTPLEILDASRGAKYDKQITIISRYDKEQFFSLSTGPEIDGWVSFYNPGDLENAIDRVTIPANEKVKLVARFAIPEDAPNPVYESDIFVSALRGDVQQGDVSGAGVTLQVPIPVIIKIAGTAIIEGSVSKTFAEDAEAGMPLNISVDFTNGSNIEIAPTISAAIVKADVQLAKIVHNNTRVKPGENKTITLIWDSQGNMEGRYLINVDVTLAGKSIASQQLAVNLLPPGAIKVEGDFVSLQYEGKPAAGVMTNSG